MAQKSRGGMGSKKHGTHGVAPKSPKLRHRMKLEAERNEHKKKKTRLKKNVKDLFDNYD